MQNRNQELQNIICSDEPSGERSDLKKVQTFLRRHAQTGSDAQANQRLEGEEAVLIAFAKAQSLFYSEVVSETDFVASGAEQRVYRYDDFHVVKLNDRIFYASWLDYFNSLLIHNYFFPATAYKFLGFKIIDAVLYAVVLQEFVVANKTTDLSRVKEFLAFNGFKNTRNNDYLNPDLGVILEDLHDENVLTQNGILFFVDTVFYLPNHFCR